KELIRPDRRRDDGAEMFRFRHLLIRDAAYDSLPKAERAELHERFADWLESSAGERLAELDEIVGYHLAQARTYRLDLGPDDERTKALALRAGRRLLAAGKRADARDDYEPAKRLLTEAAALLVEDVAAHFEALMATVETVSERSYAEALDLAVEAEQVGAGISEQATLRARTWVWAGRSRIDPSFTLEGLLPQLDAAVGAFEAAGDQEGLMDALQGLVLVHLNKAHWAETAAAARRALEVATANGFDSRAGDFRRWYTNALVWGQLPAGDGLRIIAELMPQEARRSQRAAMLGALTVLHGLRNDRAAVMAADAEAAAIDQELGDRPHRFRHSFALYALGDLEAGLAGARAEEAELARLGETGQRSTMVSLQAWMHAVRGENEEALRRAEDGRRLGAADDAVTQLLWRTAAGLAHAQLGQLDEADRLSTEAVALALQTDSLNAADAWEARAHVLARLGRRDEMLEAAARAHALHEAKGSVNFLKRLDRFLADQGVDRSTLDGVSARPRAAAPGAG
ncbi:MAG TPA: hypothetical protein VF484_09930, partial [Candidatus Limnocylindrales bacterium]